MVLVLNHYVNVHLVTTCTDISILCMSFFLQLFHLCVLSLIFNCSYRNESIISHFKCVFIVFIICMWVPVKSADNLTLKHNFIKLCTPYFNPCLFKKEIRLSSYFLSSSWISCIFFRFNCNIILYKLYTLTISPIIMILGPK